MKIEKIITNLAREAAETYVKENKIIAPPSNIPKKLSEEKGGVFITIKKESKLRGCIGTYLPTKKNIAEEIIDNTISVVSKDYRFGKVEEEELNLLSYEVSILEKPKLVEKIETLDPKKYGIIVEENNSKKSGLLLPDIDGINTVKEQLIIACKKAGIEFKKKGDISIYCFKVEKYKE